VDRTTLSIPGPLLEHLRVAAAERCIPMAALVHEAIEEKLAAHRPKPRFLGIGDSGLRDTARRAADGRPKPRPWC